MADDLKIHEERLEAAWKAIQAFRTRKGVTHLPGGSGFIQELSPEDIALALSTHKVLEELQSSVTVLESRVQAEDRPTAAKGLLAKCYLGIALMGVERASGDWPVFIPKIEALYAGADKLDDEAAIATCLVQAKVAYAEDLVQRVETSGLLPGGGFVMHLTGPMESVRMIRRVMGDARNVLNQNSRGVATTDVTQRLDEIDAFLSRIGDGAALEREQKNTLDRVSRQSAMRNSGRKKATKPWWKIW